MCHAQPAETVHTRGETLTIKQWAEKSKIPVKTINARLRLGWTIEDAVSVVRIVGSSKGKARQRGQHVPVPLSLSLKTHTATERRTANGRRLARAAPGTSEKLAPRKRKRCTPDFSWSGYPAREGVTDLTRQNASGLWVTDCPIGVVLPLFGSGMGFVVGGMKPPEREPDHGQANHGLAREGTLLAVHGEPPAPLEPRECAPPSLRASGACPSSPRAGSPPRSPTPRSVRPTRAGRGCGTCCPPTAAPAGELLSRDLLRHARGRCPVVVAGGGHRNRNHRPIVSTATCRFPPLTFLWLSRPGAHRPRSGVVNGSEGAVVSPRAEVLVGGALGREVRGHVTPRAPSEQVEDRVDHVPGRGRAGPTAGVHPISGSTKPTARRSHHWGPVGFASPMLRPRE